MKKEYIIKLKNTQVFIKSFENKTDMYTFDIKNAKRYEQQEAESIIKNNKELEAVNCQRELYKLKNERFKLFVNTLMIQENINVSNEDLIAFEKELKDDGIYVACTNLKNKYPQNILIIEMDRIAQKIEFKMYYEKKPELYKSYKELCEEYDYDDERQLEILKLTFYEKYITRNITEESEIEMQEA